MAQRKRGSKRASKRDDLLEPVREPGKFEGARKLAMVLHGEQGDETEGDVSEIGVIHDLFLDLDKDPELRGRIGDVRAAILTENDQGFVDVETFEDTAEALEAWDSIRDDVASMYEDRGDEY